jgi:LPXTG-site transpeptidase (sortase) family protein
MQAGKRNHWLAALGVLLLVLGIADAISVVMAARTASANIAQTEPGGVKSGAVRATTEAQASGFLPLQAPSGEAGGPRPTPGRRAWLELESEGASEQLEGQLRLPPAPQAETPQLLWIPAIELYAPVLPVELELVEIEGVEYDQWTAPAEFAAGWHASSAPLGEAGNTVLNGHHNVYGEVFRHLVDLAVGDEIVVYSDRSAHYYSVVERVIFPERFAKPEQRVENAGWVLPTDDERLTLITCWPYESNTHRLVLVAKPIPELSLAPTGGE